MLLLVSAGLAAGEFAPSIVMPLVLLPVLISVYPRAYRAGQLCVFLASAAKVIEFRIGLLDRFCIGCFFRSRLTTDTLGLGYILPAAGQIRDFHL